MKKKMKLPHLFSTLILMTTIVVFSGCEKDDPEPPIVEELITTLNYTLTPDDGSAAVVFTFQDLDGDDGNDPVITTEMLSANTTYSGSIELLNESITPIEDITEEVAEEDEAHQFFFQSNTTGLNIAYNDTDPMGNPVGLISTLTTGAAATGSITITLRHEPDKDATGVSGGDIDNAGGATDIEVTFPIDVQ